MKHVNKKISQDSINVTWIKTLEKEIAYAEIVFPQMIWAGIVRFEMRCEFNVRWSFALWTESTCWTLPPLLSGALCPSESLTCIESAPAFVNNIKCVLRQRCGAGSTNQHPRRQKWGLRQTIIVRSQLHEKCLKYNVSHIV